MEPLISKDISASPPISSRNTNADHGSNPVVRSKINHTSSKRGQVSTTACLPYSGGKSSGLKYCKILKSSQREPDSNSDFSLQERQRSDNSNHCVRKAIAASDANKTDNSIFKIPMTPPPGKKSKSAAAIVTYSKSAVNTNSAPRTTQKLPNATIQKLPNATIQKLPNTTIQKLTNAIIKKLPKATTQKLPNATIQKLPNAIIKKLPEATTQKLPNVTTQKLPNVTTQKLPNATTQKLPNATTPKAEKSGDRKRKCPKIKSPYAMFNPAYHLHRLQQKASSSSSSRLLAVT